VKVEGLSIGRQGPTGAKEALASAHSCRATKFQATTLLILTPVNYLETGNTGIAAIFTEVKKGATGNSIDSAPGIYGDDGSHSYLLDSEAIVLIAIIGRIHRG